MTKKEAIQDLLTYDHLIMSTESAERICDPFNVSVPDERTHPGAYQKNRKPVIGIASEELAVHICKRLNIDYVLQRGRGSQLRMCCKALSQSI